MRKAGPQAERVGDVHKEPAGEMPIEEFDTMLWMSMVKRVTVKVDGQMMFTFSNEMDAVI